MPKRTVVLGLCLAGSAVFAALAFARWAFFEGDRMGGGWRSLGPVWPYLAAGVLTVAALTGLLVWLAVYSAKHGYDDRIDPDGH